MQKTGNEVDYFHEWSMGGQPKRLIEKERGGGRGQEDYLIEIQCMCIRNKQTRCAKPSLVLSTADNYIISNSNND